MSRSSLKDRGGGGKAYGSIKIETESSDTFEDEPLLTRNRRDSTSIWSILAGLWRSLVFGWFTPVLKGIQEQLDLGRSPDLENEEAIPPLPKEDSTSYLTSQFEELWKKEQQTAEQPSLVPCLWKAFSPLFIQAGFLKAIHDCLQFVGPQVLNGLIQFLRTPSDSMSTGIMLTATVTVAQLCMSLCLRHYFFRCYRVSLRIRTCVLLAIYQKSLTIDPSYYQKHPVGQITNLMSVDVQRLQDVVTYLHAIWYSFLQIALAMYFLWQQLGPSCLAGVGVILASIPLTAVSAQWMGRLQKKLMEKKDDRVQTNQETIVNMKVVKLQAWEGPFRDKVKHLRRLELRQLLHYALAQACTGLMWSAVPLLIALSTFAAYVTIAGHSLDVASALTALALFEILRFPLFMLPYVINMLVEAGVALKRIEDFLSAPDHVPPPRLEDPNTVIQLSNATFSYRHVLPSTNKKNSTVQEHLEKTEEELLLIKAKLADAEEHLAELEGRPYKRYESTVGSSKRYDSGDDSGDEEKIDSAPEKLLSLRRANFECKEGEFIAIVGSVGSGKSTFLKSILGEVQRISGEVGVRGKLAYFDQKPFIMNDTVEGNVLFGKSDKDIELYKLAIQSCCLEHDLTLLPNGDQCEIGERGITLSGGQKARIAMARVVYHNADISLLDDCLSAVDAHVGRDMFDQCIINVLLQRNNENAPKRKRTVILVTNALQYLSHPMLDRIVVLKNGLVVETGSYKELLDRESSRFKSLLYAFNESMEGEYGNGSEENPMGEDVTGLNTEDAADGIDGVGEGSISELGLSERVVSSCRLLMSESVSDIEKVAGKLMTDEMAEREIGKVDREVYMTWAKAAGGLWVIIPLLLVFAAGECMSVLSNWWLTYWSHAATPDSESQMHFLGIYGLINVIAIFTDFLRMATVTLLGLQASKKLFSELLDSTLKAPMSFFDTTPAGRIMNRFSKDVYTLDEALPSSFRMYLNCMFQVMSTLVVVTSVTPIFSAILIPTLYFYRRQQAYFSQCYRELKRIDAVTRSPIYALFGETLDGPSTIRAFAAEEPLFRRMGGLIDRQQHAFFLTQAGLCWLAVRLELIGTAIVFCACMAAVMQKRNNPAGDEIFAGLAGLSISYALAVTQSLNWAVRVGSDFEANMVSVERIRQYCNLESEAPHDTDADKKLDKDWPTKGVIEFRNSKLRYRPGLPLVLKGLNLTIPGQSKVGIVGRTGAGKSTLMTALMRLVELDGGEILIDGVDTKTLGLSRLRSSIAVIPQDPVLFSGTVKTNLDPFDMHTDDRLTDALKRVGLWTSSEAASAVNSLRDSVLQDGGNFSVGQRQLLVIARALLDGAGVVICDEATAAIDAEADARIQRVLRNDFANATTLTVAHRLNTIMDSTHILVMADGKAVEFDTPSNLLAKGGLFKDLVDRWEEEHEG